ncbi:lysozyme inhibitor LprI family protein [Acetobacter aceti]|nr:lysozyme inhibitor LprI family protein [Acetobacter aceti]
MRIIWLVALGAITLPRQVAAASFNCASVSAPKDKFICQNPELSALDDQLSHVYKQKIEHLSPYGADLLRKSERNWLRYINIICPITLISTNDSHVSSVMCLKSLYQERLQDLDAVARKMGPFLFNQVDSFAAEPYSNSDNVPEFSTQHLSYPQIDFPKSANTVTWNKVYDKGQVSTDTECDSQQGNEDIRYDVRYVNNHVISVAWTDYTYCDGTPHGFFSSGSDNRVWDQGSRELTPTDVFTTGWPAKLQQLFWDALLKKGWKPRDDEEKRAILETVIEPKKWSFTNEGLSVSFGAYDAGCYGCDPGVTTVRWINLRPLLTTSSLLP